MIWLVASALAGEVTIWHAWRGEERAALETLAAQYTTEHPGVTILPVFVPHESLASKSEAAIPRGNGPDLLIFGHDRLADWSRLGVIKPVDWEADGAAHDALQWDGKNWGWPLAAKSLALYRNTSLLPDAPATSDEMIAAAKRLTTGDQYGLVFEIASAYQDAPWLHAFGGGVFRDGKVLLDSPENVAAFTFLQHLAMDVVPPDPSGALVTQLFNEGRAAMILNGPWFLGEVDPKIPFAVSPLPVLSETGKPAAPYVTIETMFLARENPEAVAFGAWFAGPEAAKVRSEVGREIVPNAETTDPILSAFRAQLDHAVPMPTQPEMAQTWEPLARSLRRLVRGAATPEQAAAEAQTQYDIVTRPPAPATSPTPYLVIAALGVLTAIGLAARSAVRDRAWSWLWVGAWIGPAFGAMTLLVLLPFVVGASVSLFEYDGATFTFVGLAHFFDILFARDFPITSPLSFWSTLVVTIVWTVTNVALHAGLGVALAMLLREPWVRMRGLFRAALILPWAIPSYITALVWKGMFHRQFGAINALLVAVGAEPVSWFGQFSTAFTANLVTNTWLGFPFMMVVTLGALQSIPRDLEEAAEVDGASGWQRFRNVTLPLLKPALLPAIVLGSVWTFNQFNVIYLVSGGEPDGTTDILVSQAYRWAFTRGHRYGYAAAYAMIIFGVLVLYGRVANRIAGRKVV